MEKIISNRCNEQGSAYITLSDILGGAIHYDSNGKFEYIQSSSGSRYTNLQGTRVDINLRLTDPTAEADQANILAKNAAKSVEVKVDPKVESCVKINQKNISIDTTGHGCSIEKLLGTDDTIKITLKGNVELNREFAQLGGSVSFTGENCKWINLGLNECELSQHKVKITNDCKCNKPDTEAFKEHRNDITVKSEKSGEKVGSVNLSAWYFKNNELYYDLALDTSFLGKVGDETYYLKVMPCTEKDPYRKLALCDKDGKVITQTKGGATISIDKCNFVEKEDIELKDFVREDGLPSLIIKPSISKEFGEAAGSRSRAEVYKYDPDTGDSGDKVGKLSATTIKGFDRDNGKTFTVYNYLLPENREYTSGQDYNSFITNNVTNTTITEKNGLYDMSNKLYQANNSSSSQHSKQPIDAKITKLLLDDLLCLFDQSSLQDGVQIIG